jgi:sortase A
LLSTLAILLGLLILLLVGAQWLYAAFSDWLDQQTYYLTSEYVAGFDIPPITPTLTPSPTPTPEPEPMPAVRIMIPKIDVNERIVETGVTTTGWGANERPVWETPAYAVGHRKISAHPGQNGNIVLSGHNNTLGEVFRDLDKLEAGDEIYLYTLDEEFVYIVKEKHKVPMVGITEESEAEHLRYTARTPDETLTLISCWPYATFTHRIYIIAKSQK